LRFETTLVKAFVKKGKTTRLQFMVFETVFSDGKSDRKFGTSATTIVVKTQVNSDG